ncbi:hypothetical protein ABZ078_07140 [Streptomyces sp. NPDC006385]|uniref:hypothetical protein n=1 Tax=Streptomyces sp. NPDC006385 TaxID=3156761 RepID=UPI0033AC59FB
MNRSAATTRTTAARLVRTGARATATLLAAGVLALTAQGTAQAAEARPASHHQAASVSAHLRMPNLPALPHVPSLPGDVLDPIVDVLNGGNHDWGTAPLD